MSSFVHEAWRMLFAKKCLGGGKFIVFMLVPSMKREARSIFRTILNSPWPQDARPQTDATWLWKKKLKHIKSMGNSWREDLRDSLFPFLELLWWYTDSIFQCDISKVVQFQNYREFFIFKNVFFLIKSSILNNFYSYLFGHFFVFSNFFRVIATYF